MKVKDLIAELSQLPEDMEVLISSDEEGNSFSTVQPINFSEGFFKISKHGVDCVDENTKGAKQCFVIYPN